MRSPQRDASLDVLPSREGALTNRATDYPPRRNVGRCEDREDRFLAAAHPSTRTRSAFGARHSQADTCLDIAGTSSFRSLCLSVGSCGKRSSGSYYSGKGRCPPSCRPRATVSFASFRTGAPRGSHSRCCHYARNVSEMVHAPRHAYLTEANSAFIDIYIATGESPQY